MTSVFIMEKVEDLDTEMRGNTEGRDHMKKRVKNWSSAATKPGMTRIAVRP